MRQFAAERDWDQFHSPKNLASALAVEAAELLERFQWLTEDQSRKLPPAELAKVREEMADVLNYLVRLADKLDVNLIEAARDKIKLNALKYPVDKARGSAKKYSDLAVPGRDSELRRDADRCPPRIPTYAAPRHNARPWPLTTCSSISKTCSRTALAVLADAAYQGEGVLRRQQQEGRVPFKLFDAMLALGANVEHVKVDAQRQQRGRHAHRVLHRPAHREGAGRGDPHHLAATRTSTRWWNTCAPRA